MFFKNKITKMVEKTNKLSGEIEVLKKQQKVKAESLIKENADKKTFYTNAGEATIANYKVQIEIIKNNIKLRCSIYDQELKVNLDKACNGFDGKILKKTNQLNRLRNLIEAEQKNNEDLIKPLMVNAPTPKVLLENKKTK